MEILCDIPLTAAPVNKHRHPLPPTKHTNKQKEKKPQFNYMLTKNPNKELMAFIAETEDISLVEGTAIPTGVDFKKDETLIRLPVEVCKILRERYPKDVGCPSATL